MYIQILLVNIKFNMNDESYFLSHIQQSEISHKSFLLLHVDLNNRNDNKNSEVSQIFIICSAFCMYLLFEA